MRIITPTDNTKHQNGQRPEQCSEQRAGQEGFTLIEMLLTVMLFGGVMVVLFAVLQDLSERELAKSTAGYMQKVSAAVEETMTSDINNFLGFYNDAFLDSVNLNAEYDVALFVNGGVVGATAPRTIPPSSVLNANFAANNPLKQEIKILISVADDPLVADDPPALEILIVANSRSPDEITRKAANEAGPNGAFIRRTAVPLNPTAGIISAFGSWEMPIGRFIDLPWYLNVEANPPSPEEGVYLVHRLYMNVDDIAGDYLFRTPQADPEFHTMLTPLNLGGNNIVGVDDLITSGNMTVNSQIIVQGSAYFGGQLSVQGSLYGDGRATAANVNVNHDRLNAGDTGFINNATLSSPNYSLGGNNNVLTRGDMTITKLNIQGGGDISADTATLQNVRISEIDMARSGGAGGTARIQGDFNAADGSFVGMTSLQVAAGADVRFSNSMQATEMVFNGGGNSLDVSNGRTGIVNMNTAAPIVVTGDVSAPRISVENFGVTNFGLCDEGCGE